jgi:acyl-CoA reductase-like NAD-dependent aldehyde dehydrogenase
VLKPASLTPVGALIIGEVLAETELPVGAFSILPVPREQADLFATDDRFKLLSFTGSPAVGWALKAKAGRKKVVLELGGNAAVIVDRDADLADATKRIVFGAFYQSGQSCIGVQRILIHEDVADAFTRRLVEAVHALRPGDPLDPATELGPMIDERSAARVAGWIDDAVAAGAQLATGGTRAGNRLAPTVLLGAPPGAKVNVEEVFAPLVTVQPYRDFAEAVREVNASRYGLQAGVFTRDIGRIEQAWDELDVGGVMINEVPSWRVDHMPYGGVKDSGLGREGVRSAMAEMTEERLLIIGR